MRTKIVAALLAVFVLCNVASAQDYQIRVTNNTNLRASYSLESAVVEKASAGTTLQVVGKFNRWLEINRNGISLWMADWVGFTRVEGGEQATTQTQTSSAVNNCCFVDRQCNTDNEWTDGYWAFQNNQCEVPTGIQQQQTQSEQQTASQPGAYVPTQIDNCCYLGRDCANDSDFTLGFWDFLDGKCPLPTRTVHGLIVEAASDAFAYRVEEALNVLQSRAPSWYTYTINGLDKIREVAETSGVGVDTSLRRFDLTPSHAFPELGGWSSEAGVLWLAGVFVHEACHVYRHEAGFPYTDETTRFREEVICQQVQIDALTVFDPERRFNEYLSGLINDFFGRGHQI